VRSARCSLSSACNRSRRRRLGRLRYCILCRRLLAVNLCGTCRTAAASPRAHAWEPPHARRQGCTERHHAAPEFTDSGRRRFSTQISTQKAAQRNRNVISPPRSRYRPPARGASTGRRHPRVIRPQPTGIHGGAPHHVQRDEIHEAFLACAIICWRRTAEPLTLSAPLRRQRLLIRRLSIGRL
jgi:hypothetical protein